MSHDFILVRAVHLTCGVLICLAMACGGGCQRAQKPTAATAATAAVDAGPAGVQTRGGALTKPTVMYPLPVEATAVKTVKPATETPAAKSPAPQPFAHMRIDMATKRLEIDGMIAVDVHDEHTPRVWLEVLVCTPDSKEHEAVVVSRARPSDVHAALLLLGFVPGEPGRVEWDGTKPRPIAPRGQALSVRIECEGKSYRPEELITLSSTNAAPDPMEFVFAGSGTVRRRSGNVYAADEAGTLIGLSTFGTETIALMQVHSPDTGLEPAEFLAVSTLPKMGTPVKVVLEAVAGR